MKVVPTEPDEAAEPDVVDMMRCVKNAEEKEKGKRERKRERRERR